MYRSPVNKPVVVIFDSTEYFTDDVKSWLEQLLRRTQVNQDLTLVVGGRQSIEWEAWEMRQVHYIQELALFSAQDTKDQWERLMATSTFAGASAEICHRFTYGHPASNVRVAKIVKESDPGKTQSRLWPEILSDLAESMLGDLVGNRSDSADLKQCARILAALRSFDRYTAAAMFDGLRRDLIPAEGRNLAVQSRLASLCEINLLDKSHAPLYQMQCLIRSFIVDDLRSNETNRYISANQVARDHYVQRVTEIKSTDVELFHHLVLELLYHEAILHQPALAAPGIGPVYNSELDTKLTNQLEECLRGFNSMFSEYFDDLCLWLAHALEEDMDFKKTVGDGCFNSVVARLQDLCSQPPLPPSPAPVRPQAKQEPETTPVTTPLRFSHLVYFVVVAFVVIISFVALAHISTLVKEWGRLTLLVPAGLLVSALLVFALFGIMGRLGPKEIADLLRVFIERIQWPGGHSGEDKRKDKK